MVSSPSYDPNPFVKGISYQAYKSLLQDKDRTVTRVLNQQCRTLARQQAFGVLLQMQIQRQGASAAVRRKPAGGPACGTAD
jgi:penicillin-binding protein 2